MGKDIIIEEEGRGGIILYQTADGKSNLEVKLENDTVWLNVNQMSKLFCREESNIRRHIINIFKEINARGTTVLMATHNPDFYMNSPFRRLALDHGELLNRDIL